MNLWVRIAISVVISIVIAVIVTIVRLNSLYDAAASDGPHPRAPITIITPVEELLTYDAGARGSTEPVYSQCDTHGHRVFASRHPIRFVVVADPSCPGGGTR